MSEKIQVAKTGATQYGPYIETPDGKRYYTGTAAPEVKEQVEATLPGEFVTVDWTIPKGGKYKIIQKLTIAPKEKSLAAAPSPSIKPIASLEKAIKEGIVEGPKEEPTPKRQLTEGDYILVQVCLKAAVELAGYDIEAGRGVSLADVVKATDTFYKGCRKSLAEG